MLVNNRIYHELYNFGYSGEQNPYEFWLKIKDELLDYLWKSDIKLIDDSYQLDAFEAKLRWRTPLGKLLEFEIQNILSSNNGAKTNQVDSISVKYDGGDYSINDFNELYPLSNADLNIKTDVRGISIINTDIESFSFKDIDLRYASINSCICKNLYFENCKMDYTTLNRSEFRECHFDNRCSMYSVDFSDSLLKSEFECEIEKPIVSYLDKKDVRGRLFGIDPRWRAFTEIDGNSFIQSCNNVKLNEYIIAKQNKIKELQSIQNSGVIPKVTLVFKNI